MDCDPTIPTRRSITYLQLSNITLNEGALTDLLGKLPYLKHFSLLHFTLEGSGSSNEEHGGEDDKNIFCIDMPSKSLGTLQVDSGDREDCAEGRDKLAYEFLRAENDARL
jgi:hypothetical protein